MSLDKEKYRRLELADFLKTRRAKISPTDVGLIALPNRRTPGLKREEIAQLSGISITWYTWLEQGRDIRVSEQVLESLSRVFSLDNQERNHLYILANQTIPAQPSEHVEKVSPILQNVLDSFTYSPSVLIDQHWNVLGWNNISNILFGDFNKMTRRERNIVWAMFTEDRYKHIYVDWDMHAKRLISMFRATCSQCAWLSEFTKELMEISEEFRQWWPLHEIQSNSGVIKQLNFPTVGILDFEVTKFDVSDNTNMKLIIHTPSPNTDTICKMKVLLGEKS